MSQVLPISSSKNILVIDNDHDTRVLLRTILEREGYFVITVTNAAEALADLFLSMSPPSLILISEELPIMTADDFLRELKESPALAKIPVGFLGYGFKASLGGTSIRIQKPIRVAQVIADLKKVFP
jgi:CheY-like chemotaxis protein